MRALILIAVAALALSACGNKGQTDGTQNVDESLSAENIVSNDVTAIDAVTGDAANMAADVNYMDFSNGLGNSSNDVAASDRPRKPVAKQATPSPAPAESAVTNAPANATE
jgi:hypothetical protein